MCERRGQLWTGRHDNYDDRRDDIFKRVRFDHDGAPVHYHYYATSDDDDGHNDYDGRADNDSGRDHYDHSRADNYDDGSSDDNNGSATTEHPT